MVAFYLICGSLPFKGATPLEVLDAVISSDVHVAPDASPDFASLVKALLHKRPTHRAGCASEEAEDIKAAPWFGGVDWDAVAEGDVDGPAVEPMEESPKTLVARSWPRAVPLAEVIRPLGPGHLRLWPDW